MSNEQNESRDKEQIKSEDQNNSTNNKKNPYDLRNKSSEKIPNYYYSERLMDSITFKNELDLCKTFNLTEFK